MKGRQPSNRSETARGIVIEGQVEEAGVSTGQIQETSGGKEEVSTIDEHASKEQ